MTVCLSFFLLIAGLAAYSNSFHVPFLFDDFYGIVNNPNLRAGVPLWKLLSGSIRPVVEVSFAINDRLNQLNVWGYHAVNLAVHALAAGILFHLVRRTLRLRRAEENAAWSEFLAFCSALIWLLHPLQTQAVVYIVQRAESLMGLFYFLTLYALLRSVDTPRWSGRWQGAAVLACLLGTWTKAGMVTAPIAALLYDRIFLAGSFPEAFRIRRWLYLGLAGTWIAAAALNISWETAAQTFAHKERAIGFSSYLLTQPSVILRYLRLAVWPKPLVFDYADWPILHRLSWEMLPAFLFLAGLALAAFFALRRRPAAGFLAAWVFLTLLPTSLFPLPDAAFEFRMYLPLAGLAVGWVFSLEAARRRWIRPKKRGRIVLAVVLLAAAGLLGHETFLRNQDYRDRTALWRDTVSKRPANGRAWGNLGAALLMDGNFEEAQAALTRAVDLDPKAVQACCNLGRLHAMRNEWERALFFYEKAAKIQPRFAPAQEGKGLALERMGRDREAFVAYSEALGISQDLPEAHHGLGVLLCRKDRWRAAALEFGQAIRCKPDYASAYRGLGVAFSRTGLLQGAIFAYSQAIRLDPGDQESPVILEQLKKRAAAPVSARKPPSRKRSR